MNGISTPTVINAIAALRRDDGTIHPEDIVEAAREEASPLHRYFEWDDSAAAAAWRIEQAQRLLRVTVTLIPVDGKNKPIRAFVSLSNEKGYRQTGSVLVNAAQREQLVQDALSEMQSFRRKYSHLKEVAEVVAAMGMAEQKMLESVA